MDEKICKCCGRKKDIGCFSLGNNRRPINICKECRKYQQIISNARGVNPLDMSPNQLIRFQEATDYMELCRLTTGFETGRCRGTVGLPEKPLRGAESINKSDLAARYQAAQTQRQRMEACGVILPKPSTQLIKTSTVEFIVDCGYTQKECFEILDNEIGSDDPDYDTIWDKLILIPA